MRVVHISLIVACSLLATALGAAPNWYSCNCSGRANCMCPSRTHPAADRIPLHDVPQFVLFTHDDAILEKTDASMRAVCDGRTNPNGCPARATMFTMKYNTDCDLAYRMWTDGYEISDHTVTHPPMDASMDKEQARYEIAGMRDWAQESCGIPATEIVGFRNPYLTTTPTARQVLHEEGFLYDSTLMETLTYSLSNGPGQRVWPYTMDFGIAQNCGFFAPAQKCNPQNETYPGLWQVPMWPLLENGQESMMDYGPDDDYSLYNLLVANFDASYNGNRAPLPIYIHTPWLTERRLKQLQRFADYSIGKGAYWVTITQLLNWMRNPVPASQLKLSMAMCGRAPSPPPPPPPAPAKPLPTSGLNITLVFEGGDPAQLAASKPALEALVSSLLGGSQAAAAVREVKPLPAAPTSTAAGRTLLGMAEAPTASPSAFGTYSGGGMVAAVQQEAAGGHLQSGWRLLAGGAEVSFGDSTVASFLQYESPSAAAAQRDLSMASMHGGSGTVAAANLAAGVPVGMLPQAVPAGRAAAGQQVGVGARPQAALGGSLPGAQQLPQRPLAAGPGNPAGQRPAGMQQPRVPAQPGGTLWQQAGLAGQQPGAAAGGGAALWQAVDQLQAAVPARKAVAGQQAGAGVRPQAPAVPSGAAAKPAGVQAQPAVPTGAAVKPAPVQVPSSPPPPPPPPSPSPPPPPPPPQAPSPPPPQAANTASQQAAEQLTKPGVLQVTLVAAASDPLAVYTVAAPRFRDAGFASKLRQMGWRLAAEPELVPFKNGKAVPIEQHKSLPHSPPPPAPQPPALDQQAAEPDRSEAGANVGGNSGTSSSSGGGTAQSSSSDSTPGSGSSSSGGIAGLPTGAFVGVVAAGTAVVAALAVLAALVLRRRSKACSAAAAAAGKQATGSSNEVQPHGGEQVGPKSPREGHHSIQLEASANGEAPNHPHMM